ncbi:MAG: hypothetical protein Q7T60_15975 [Sphingopyxis sp.]|nr:hypothetical protein [Sphingopyxis sp.]
MKDELWMRTWNDGHPRFSDDLHRGILWLLTPFQRLGKGTTPRANPDQDALSARIAPRQGERAHSKAG